MSIRDARIRDRRRKDWFSVDNEILDDFGDRIGLHGFAVYCALARYSWDGTEEASVSLRTLAKRLKMGQAKLLESLHLLKTVGLIDIEPGNRTTSSVYILLEVPKTGGASPQKHGASEEKQGGASEEKRNKTTSSQNSSKGDQYDLKSYLFRDR